jgi:hypothetical protein
MRFAFIASSALLFGTLGEARAQYSAISAPFGSASSSFSENIGVNWGFSGPNFFFNNGGAGTLPPFGGHDPNADGAFGFNVRGNNTNFFFNVRAGQGSNQTFTSQTPTIVVPNGFSGSLFDGQQRPFVTGIIPVVGSGAWLGLPAPSTQAVSPLAERLSRLQAEQAMRDAVSRSRQERANAELREERRLSTAAPAAPAKDDPPLILGAP